MSLVFGCVFSYMKNCMCSVMISYYFPENIGDIHCTPAPKFFILFNLYCFSSSSLNFSSLSISTSLASLRQPDSFRFLMVVSIYAFRSFNLFTILSTMVSFSSDSLLFVSFSIISISVVPKNSSTLSLASSCIYPLLINSSFDYHY